ncbi:DUF1707 SHOCT-like domain-containing protein [Cutibacterium sp. V947]|uniref:DUF1707 SHOCT-like domain-containing protein n=1 Tax=unclassified Cutibacterium TaxID=2649671 RepID=UPI003EDEEE54
MNSYQPWQSGGDQWLVNDVQRDRVVAFLRTAYVDGRLSSADFEDRVSRALAAVTRADLNATLNGLAVIGGQARSSRAGRVASGESLAAGLIGLSPLFLGPLGPMLGVAMSPRGSWTRRQVAHQANFQVLALLLAMVVLGVAANTTMLIIAFPLAGMAWFAGTIIHAARAFEGVEWTNPLLDAIPLKFFDDGRRRLTGSVTRGR